MSEKAIPIEDTDFDYGAFVPNEKMIQYARSLLEIPGQFSVQMLAGSFAQVSLWALADMRRSSLADQLEQVSASLILHIQTLCNQQYKLGVEYVAGSSENLELDGVMLNKTAKEFRALLVQGAKIIEERRSNEKEDRR